MIHAAYILSLYPAGVQKGATVCAFTADQVGIPALAAIQCEGFSENANPDRLPGLHRIGKSDGVPKFAKQLPHRRLNTRLRQ
jgi:hypothetical protein